MTAKNIKRNSEQYRKRRQNLSRLNRAKILKIKSISNQDSHDSIPDFVFDIGDRLYSLSIKLYGSAFAVCAGFMASVYPYMFVSECKFMYSAKGAMHTIVSFFTFYILGLLVLITVNFSGVIVNFTIASLSVLYKKGFIRRNWKRHYFDPQDRSSFFIRTLFHVLALVIWLIGTAMAVRFANLELTVPDLWGAVTKAAKLCPPNTSP
ncbi:hypothetical protein ABNQ39_07005 [Azospirillum sp. A26]|uniref:hypothetical protein n=1 Tax=Azospirillum sp. A26 TaxID=3160607 RepID=UPI0036708458